MPGALCGARLPGRFTLTFKAPSELPAPKRERPRGQAGALDVLNAQLMASEVDGNNELAQSMVN